MFRGRSQGKTFLLPADTGSPEEQISSFCALVAESVRCDATVDVFVKIPRYDFFVRPGRAIMSFLTFEEFAAGPGLWLPSNRHGELYGEWLLGFQCLGTVLREEHGIEPMIIRESAVSRGRHDDGAELDEDALEKAPSLITTFRHQADDATSRKAKALVLTTYQNNTGEEPIALCAVSIVHDESGIIEQRNYFPTSEEGFDLLLGDVASWAGSLGVPIHTVELDVPEVCSCCGDLAGRTSAQALTTDQPTIRREAVTSRNEPCPCGSGKKYKRCCGA